MFISTLQCHKAVNDLYREYKKTGKTEGLWITINGSTEIIEKTLNWLQDNFIAKRTSRGGHSSFMFSIYEDNLNKYYKELSQFF